MKHIITNIYAPISSLSLALSLSYNRNFFHLQYTSSSFSTSSSSSRCLSWICVFFVVPDWILLRVYTSKWTPFQVDICDIEICMNQAAAANNNEAAAVATPRTIIRFVYAVFCACVRKCVRSEMHA